MASFWSFLGMLIVFMAYFSSRALTSQVLNAQLSTISAAPAFLPEAPLSSSYPPSFPPDTEPLFPTPVAGEPPAVSSLPTIPASPSPPNPDSSLAPGPELAISPSGSLPASSSVSLSSSASKELAVIFGLLVFGPMQLFIAM